MTSSEAGRRARQAGIQYERDTARRLRELGLHAARRQRGVGYPDRGDIELEELPGWHIECKKYADTTRAIREALPKKRLERAKPRLGIVYRRGYGIGGSLVATTLDEFADLIGHSGGGGCSGGRSD